MNMLLANGKKRPVVDRLRIDPREDLAKLVTMYLADDSEDAFRKGAAYFEAVTAEPASVTEHPPVVGISIGGSYTKVAIAEMRRGRLVASYLRKIKNPESDIHFYDFLDNLLCGEVEPRRLLEQSGGATIGLSIPVMIDANDIPHHPTKLWEIKGLMARSPEEFTADLAFPVNLERYLEARQLKNCSFFCETDPIVAHLGSVYQADIKSSEQSLLLVCGTGMAIADYDYSRTISRLPMLDFDEELFPDEQTEHFGYEYSFAGVGLYGLMDRAIRIKAREPGSVLNAKELSQFFKDRYDSKTVSEIWESTLPNPHCSEKVQAIIDVAGAEGFKELQELASAVGERMVVSLANALIAVAVKKGRDKPGQLYVPLYEGGVILNPNRLPLVENEIKRRLNDAPLFERLQVTAPTFNFSSGEDPADSTSESRAGAEELDVTTVGALVGAIFKSVVGARS